MVNNRSVPTNAILPHLAYRDVAEAIAWLTGVFGFSEHYHYGDPAGPIGGAQMRLGNAWIMLKRARTDFAAPVQLAHRSQGLTVFVEDVRAHFQTTKLAGAKIVEDLQETVYGELQYGVEDLDGHQWLFSQHIRDLSPSAWGATLIER